MKLSYCQLQVKMALLISIHFFIFYLKYVLIGFPNKPSNAHASQLSGITDLSVHDLFHAYLPLISNNHAIINN